MFAWESIGASEAGILAELEDILPLNIKHHRKIGFIIFYYVTARMPMVATA
jgi:hypothetical protein